MEFIPKEVILICIGLFAIECTHIRIRERSHYRIGDHEEVNRMEVYSKRKDQIFQHNHLFDEGLVTFKMGLNAFSDLTDDEFINLMDGMKLFEPLRSSTENGTKDTQQLYLGNGGRDLPRSVDWRKRGAVTSVKRQGDNCGSCWAFSSVGALEGQHFRKTGHLLSLSPQNLIDCTDTHGNGKCDGRSRHEAFDWIKEHGGIESEKMYPYQGKGGHCKFNRKRAVATLRGYMDIPNGDEKRLQEAIANVGPISVAIDATHESFWYYSSGIYYEPKCNGDKVNHAMLAVGYGTDDKGHDYFLLKNSWGDNWGEDGYIRIARNKKNHCGIASYATYPVV